MLCDDGVGGAENVREVAQAEPQHHFVRHGEVEENDVSPEQHVANKDLRHVAVHLHTGGVQLRKVPYVVGYSQQNTA